MFRLVCLLIGYICGLLQTSYIIGRINHIDIREHGSGNAGTTNAARVLGPGAGALTLLCDCLKCVVAVLIARYLYAAVMPGNMILLPCMYAGAGCILGHNFPFYLHFRGGKGIAASIGLVLTIDLRMFLICAIAFFLVFFITHYVSLSSLSGYWTSFVVMIVFCWSGVYQMTVDGRIECCILMGLLAFLATMRHWDNLRRLSHGVENKTYLTKRHEQ